MRWIKASERLPDKTYSFGGDEFGCFPVRFEFEYRKVLAIGYLNNKGTEIYNAYNIKPFGDIDFLEWLDESETDAELDEAVRSKMELTESLSASHPQGEQWELVNKITKLLDAWSEWEANIIEDDKAWPNNQMTINGDHYDRMLELQVWRNEVNQKLKSYSLTKK